MVELPLEWYYHADRKANHPSQSLHPACPAADKTFIPEKVTHFLKKIVA
ncbi:hypothetical protein Mal33_53300 [Rosistilla oblonga]|uniref:Uncharacterized protein n=1 Tax=Rosistilla oblonga TaxID=2527990 RepID=A0A518J1T8_9BACT|nr:hypothetical protein Mal33_53300 [Rosistilla oblonga]